jgi:hypothetical protein
MQAAIKQAAEPLRLNNKDTIAAAHTLVPRRPHRHGEGDEGSEETGPQPRSGRSRRRRRRRVDGESAPQAQGAAKHREPSPRDGSVEGGQPAGHGGRDSAAGAQGAAGGEDTAASRKRKRRRRRRGGGQRSVDIRASKDSTFSP